MNLETTRRERVELTLSYVENERRLLENCDIRLGDKVHRHRAWLLDELIKWYRAELHDLKTASSETTNPALSTDL